MDSRIILNKADFSQNNIGRYVELSELTKKVLTKQTQYSKGDSETVALETFLSSLTENGFIGGENPILNLLLIPCLASNHGELMFNIAKLDEYGYPTNSMSNDEAIATESNQMYWPFMSNGRIVGMQAHYTGEIIASQLEFNSYSLSGQGGKMNSFTFIMYRLGSAYTGGEAIIMRNHSSGSSLIISAAYAKVTYGSNTIMYASINNSKLLGFTGISYKSGDKFEAMLDDGTIGESTYNSDVTDNGTNNHIFFSPIGKQDNNLAMPIIAMGRYMTSSQMSYFKTLTNTFLSEMGVI